MPEHVDDVDLDPDRAAVAVVPGAVRALLEAADVAERATVGAAHVRVQRPAEWHPADAVQRAPTGLLAILRDHPRMVEQMFCFVQPSGAETIGLRPGTAQEVDGEPRVALEPRGRLPGQAELARRGVGGRVVPAVD